MTRWLLVVLLIGVSVASAGAQTKSLTTREHRVARVNARWIDRAGKHPSFHFSVTVESGDVYQLQLQGADLVWRVDSVALEG